MKTLVVEATNIKSGGGLTHLIEFVAQADFEHFNIERVIICATSATLNKIKERPNVLKYRHKWLEQNQFKRFLWQKFVFPEILKKYNAMLYIPGSGSPYFAYPYVTMCRNLLPIDKVEMDRFKYTKEWYRYKLLRSLHLSAFASASGLICMNNYTFNSLPISIQIKVKNLAIIPHGLNPIFKNKPKTKYTIDASIKLVYVSRLNLYKHQWVVAEAAYILCQRGYNIKLSLIGGMRGKGSDKLNSIINKYTHDFPGVVELIEELPYNDLPQIYTEADIFVFASSCETFGMILLEAMGSGLPIVCSNKSSMKEMLKDGGVYFDPLHSNSLVNSLIKVIENPTMREQMGKRAGEIAAEYDWKKTSNETLAFINKVLT